MTLPRERPSIHDIYALTLKEDLTIAELASIVRTHFAGHTELLGKLDTALLTRKWWPVQKTLETTAGELLVFPEVTEERRGKNVPPEDRPEYQRLRALSELADHLAQEISIWRVTAIPTK